VLYAEVHDMFRVPLLLRWREEADYQVVQLETDAAILDGLASNKRDQATRTLPTKIRCHLYGFPVELSSTEVVEKRSPNVKVDGFGLSDRRVCACPLLRSLAVSPL
jgi:hypothetical protein